MSDIVNVELQAIAGGLALAKRTLDDVLARVTVNPGPQNDPAKQQSLQNIVATAQLITTEAQQIQAVLAGPAPVPGAG